MYACVRLFRRISKTAKQYNLKATNVMFRNELRKVISNNPLEVK